jgi:hypothetical protein
MTVAEFLLDPESTFDLHLALIGDQRVTQSHSAFTVSVRDDVDLFQTELKIAMHTLRMKNDNKPGTTFYAFRSIIDQSQVHCTVTAYRVLPPLESVGDSDQWQ